MDNKIESEWTVLPYFRSPIKPIFNPSNGPTSSVTVNRSKSAWVGCSPLPEPAFIIGIFANFDAILAAPSSGCLMTIQSL